MGLIHHWKIQTWVLWNRGSQRNALRALEEMHARHHPVTVLPRPRVHQDDPAYVHSPD